MVPRGTWHSRFTTMIPLSLPYNKSCEISGSAIHNRYIVHWHSSCIRSTLIWFTRKNGTLRELARESKEKREGETTRETLQEKRKREREKRGEEKRAGRRKGARRISSKDETGSTVSVNGSGVYINQAAARVLAAKEFASRSIERRAEKRSRERERERENGLCPRRCPSVRRTCKLLEKRFSSGIGNASRSGGRRSSREDEED